MPTEEQLHDRWCNEFMYGKDVYSDSYNVRGSAYVGRTKGWVDIENESLNLNKNKTIMHKTKAGELIAHIKESVEKFFHMHPSTASVLDAVIKGIKEGQVIAGSDAAVKIAHMFPNGIGDKALADVQVLIAEGVPTLEIGKGALEAVTGITDPAAKADAIATYVLNNANKLPKEWQGKHVEDVIVLLCHKVLDLPLAEIELMVKAKLTTA